MQFPAVSHALSCYLAEINRFPLLSREEECELALHLRQQNDLDAAHKLVCSNLRFVVKIATEYRQYGYNLLDLIQEGNVGLMMAVRKFDSTRGVRLISYAVRWIRAYIREFILKTWSLVKLGTTQAQRKIFYKLGQAQRALPYEDFNYDKVAEKMGVSTSELKEMEVRKQERDLYLDGALAEEGSATHLDMLADNRANQEELLADRENDLGIKSQAKDLLRVLNPRERFIIENRIMAGKPMTLQDIGGRFGISRERVRQIEKTVLTKLKRRFQETGLQ
ncbi:MAG: RNA polymerase factor sigma-32 [Thermodesulfobacteriota bacterium]